MTQRPSISILLGAGFSVPMGYPVGDAMNKSVLNFDNNPVSFSPAGELCVGKDGIVPDFGYENIYIRRFKLCKALIKKFSEIRAFDYEQFMDFIKSNEVYDSPYALILSQFEDSQNSAESLIGGLGDIYNQMVDFLIKDIDNCSWYENSSTHIGLYLEKPWNSYNGFINFIKDAKKNYVINIHTLNHDLLLEALTHNDSINGDISDGFDDYGSRFYGKLRNCSSEDLTSGGSYRCRLERYTGRYYGKSIRLFKLHGSLDYVCFHKSLPNGSLIPFKEVKTRKHIGLLDLEVENSKRNGYENDISLYHADFLTGTTSKIAHYSNKTFYKKIFRKFKSNLHNSDALIIIGYGCKDEGINKIIIENFDPTKPSFIIDPCVETNQAIKSLQTQLGAKAFPKKVDDISSTWFDFITD